MKSQYKPKTTNRKLGYLVEECGEVLAAIGKTQRWGLENFNPELPVEQRETNRDWILRELIDLLYAINMLREDLIKNKPKTKDGGDSATMRDGV
jgi:NTP pyrophosphatase (non-canonical NTP hydrolase)